MATRPIANNGLGLSTAECDRTLAGVEATFPVLDDPPGLYSEWRRLVAAHDCKGKVAHDGRYVAALRCHGVADFLTFNGPDFTRFPGITLHDPVAVARSATTS